MTPIFRKPPPVHLLLHDSPFRRQPTSHSHLLSCCPSCSCSCEIDVVHEHSPSYNIPLRASKVSIKELRRKAAGSHHTKVSCSGIMSKRATNSTKISMKKHRKMVHKYQLIIHDTCRPHFQDLNDQRTRRIYSFPFSNEVASAPIIHRSTVNKV